MATILYGTTGNNLLDMTNSFQNPNHLTVADGLAGNDRLRAMYFGH